MQVLFIFLLITGTLAGLAIGALSHPKFHAAVFGGPAGSADHPESRCW
ncbi:hypothetical protein [Henriciella marina]|nr:hypothetical protein [Henriciella marina]